MNSNIYEIKQLPISNDSKCDSKSFAKSEKKLASYTHLIDCTSAENPNFCNADCDDLVNNSLKLSYLDSTKQEKLQKNGICQEIGVITKILNCHSCSPTYHNPVNEKNCSLDPLSSWLYCDFCKKNYKTKNELLKHLKMVHEFLFKKRTIRLKKETCKVSKLLQQEAIFRVNVKHKATNQNDQLEKKICHVNNKLKQTENQNNRLVKKRSMKLGYNQTNRTGKRKSLEQDYEEILTDVNQSLSRSQEIIECPYCKTQYTIKKNLVKHLQTIHGITDHKLIIENKHKPKIGYKCPECGGIFSLRKNLLQHLRKIHGKTDIIRRSSNDACFVRVMCDYCGHGFREKKSLTRHLQQKHSIKIDREKKTAGICTLCNSTFAHLKSLYKHERKFHGAPLKYKRNFHKNGLPKKSKDPSEKLGTISNYDCLVNLLPERLDYKLLQFAWLKHENNFESVIPWFKAKLYFYCDSKEDVKRWKENYENKNKLSLRVLSFPPPRTPGVIYKGRFRCHLNTMPRKGAKPNPRHTACSAVLSITLLQIDQQSLNDNSNSENRYKAIVFLKSTHNHIIGDPAFLKYRKPLREVKEKFLKLFDEKKTVTQALACHRLDLEKEYGPEKISLIVKDRAYMPDTRWAYSLYYTHFNKSKKTKRNILPKVVTENNCSSVYEQPTSHYVYSPLPQPLLIQDRYKNTIEKFKSVFMEIINRCELAPENFLSGMEAFISTYINNCNSDEQLLAALQGFSTPKVESFQTKNSDYSQNTTFVCETNFTTSSSSVLLPFVACTSNGVCIKSQQTNNSVTGSRNPANTNSSNVPSAMQETIFTLESSKYDNCLPYSVQNRPNFTSSCWIPPDYTMF